MVDYKGEEGESIWDWKYQERETQPVTVCGCGAHEDFVPAMVNAKTRKGQHSREIWDELGLAPSQLILGRASVLWD